MKLESVRLEWIKGLYRIYLNEDWDNIMDFHNFIDYAFKTKLFDIQIGQPYIEELPS